MCCLKISPLIEAAFIPILLSFLLSEKHTTPTSSVTQDVKAFGRKCKSCRRKSSAPGDPSINPLPPSTLRIFFCFYPRNLHHKYKNKREYRIQKGLPQNLYFETTLSYLFISRSIRISGRTPESYSESVPLRAHLLRTS